MDEATLQMIAAQLRHPHGKEGIETAERMNIGNKNINLYTIEALNIQPEESLLEIGMGNGFFVRNILEIDNTVSYTGLDFSADMISESTRVNEEFIENGRAQFQLGEASNIPFPDNSFDKIFTINTIYFWEDPDKVLSEFKRVIKPTGRIYISVRPKSTMQNYPFVKYGFNMFSKEDLKLLLENNNFIVLETIEREEPLMDKYGQFLIPETLIIIATL